MTTKKFPVCTHPGLRHLLAHITTEKQLTALLDMYNVTATEIKPVQWRPSCSMPVLKTLHITGGEIDITVSVPAELFNQKVI